MSLSAKNGYAGATSEEFVDNQGQKAKDLAISSLAVSVSCIFMSDGLLSFIGGMIGIFAWIALDSNTWY